MFWDIKQADAKQTLLLAHNYDTILYDPPYDKQFYKQIPYPAGKNKALIVFTSSRFLADVFNNIKEWEYRFCITWDTISSWYIQGYPLLRDNIILVFGNFKYNHDKAIVMDGIIRKKKVSSNCRGEYISQSKDWSYLSTVYTKIRSGMKKIHEHEKPFILISAILGAVDALRVIDPFCGGGAGGVAAFNAECLEYYGSDLNNDCVIMAKEFITGRGSKDNNTLNMNFDF